MPSSISKQHVYDHNPAAATGKQPPPVLDTLHKKKQSLAGWLYPHLIIIQTNDVSIVFICQYISNMGRKITPWTVQHIALRLIYVNVITIIATISPNNKKHHILSVSNQRFQVFTPGGHRSSTESDGSHQTWGHPWVNGFELFPKVDRRPEMIGSISSNKPQDLCGLTWK